MNIMMVVEVFSSKYTSKIHFCIKDSKSFLINCKKNDDLSQGRKKVVFPISKVNF